MVGGASLLAVNSQTHTALKCCLMYACCLTGNADIRHVCTIGESLNSNGNNIGGNHHLLQSATFCKGIIPYFFQAFPQHYRIQITASPERIGIYLLHGIGYYHKLYIGIVLKGASADGLHGTWNGHIFVRSPVLYQGASLHTKIGGLCLSTRLRYRKQHDRQRHNYHDDT